MRRAQFGNRQVHFRSATCTPAGADVDLRRSQRRRQAAAADYRCMHHETRIWRRRGSKGGGGSSIEARARGNVIGNYIGTGRCSRCSWLFLFPNFIQICMLRIRGEAKTNCGSIAFLRILGSVFGLLVGLFAAGNRNVTCSRINRESL